MRGGPEGILFRGPAMEGLETEGTFERLVLTNVGDLSSQSPQHDVKQVTSHMTSHHKRSFTLQIILLK